MCTGVHAGTTDSVPPTSSLHTNTPTQVYASSICAQTCPQIHGRKRNIPNIHMCLAVCPWGEFKGGFGGGSWSDPGAGVSSVLSPRGLRIPGSAPVAPLQAGRAVGQSPEPLVRVSGVLVRDEVWGLRDWPTPGSCAASIMLLPPRLAPLLAPEPSNLAGKDKHKSCVHASVDLITRQWFPGQRLDFKIRGGGAGDGMFARRVQSWSVFLWSSPY